MSESFDKMAKEMWRLDNYYQWTNLRTYLNINISVLLFDISAEVRPWVPREPSEVFPAGCRHQTLLHCTENVTIRSAPARPL